MKKNIIKFIAQNQHVFDVREKPVPALKLIPKWWKDIPKYSSPDNKISFSPYATVTVKQCAPTLDSLASGYMLTLWSDILVEQMNGEPIIRWITNEDVAGEWHKLQSSSFEIPEGFSDTIFKYYHGWTIKTPPGWSCIFLHPIGYQNIPIRAITGIVDTDILDTDINCPFVIKKGFEGIIEKGTPIAQLIPIKRADWQSEILEPSKEYEKNRQKLLTKIYGYYSSLRERKLYK